MPGEPGPGTESPGPGAAAPAQVEPPPDDDISPLKVANVLLRRWQIVVGVPLLAGFATGLYSLSLPAVFTATTTFVPEAASRTGVPAGLAGLAGRLGISMGAGASQSPQFYAEVVTSREIMERVLLAEYRDPRQKENPSDSITLLEVLQVDRDSPDANLQDGVAALSSSVSVRVDNPTNIVRLTVEAPYPTLAAAVANRFVQYLNEFNAKTRQSRARERKRFAEERVYDTERELKRAEEELQTFHQRNRSWEQSPQLVFEQGRLRRVVDIRQEIYLTLKREYETARIEEVNETPVLTVIDHAIPPRERSKPRRRLLVLLALALGGVVGVAWPLGAQYIDHMLRAEEQEYREFKGLVRGAYRKIGHPLRSIISTKRG